MSRSARRNWPIRHRFPLQTASPPVPISDCQFGYVNQSGSDVALSASPTRKGRRSRRRTGRSLWCRWWIVLSGRQSSSRGFMLIAIYVTWQAGSQQTVVLRNRAPTISIQFRFLPPSCQSYQVSNSFNCLRENHGPEIRVTLAPCSSTTATFKQRSCSIHLETPNELNELGILIDYSPSPLLVTPPFPNTNIH